MKKLLFVDDEPRVLSGLRRMLAKFRKEWDMHFADGGREALEIMEKDGPFDVIVSDMRMPVMNGVELLARVHDLYPRTVRIILSGQTDSDMTLEAAEQSHQFMSKPCDPEFLRKRIQRCCNLQNIVHNDVVQTLLAEARSLPSLPKLYAQIEQAVQDEGSMEAIGKIISHDMGMTAKVLQIVNSAFFGLPQEISDPERAAAFLGLGTIRSLVLSVEVFSSFSGSSTTQTTLEHLWEHSLAVARYAQLIAKDLGAPKDAVDDAFLAGMLHDSGKLFIAAHFPEERRKIDYLVKKGMPEFEAERAILKTSHADIAAYLYGIWGLPERMVEATGLHHDPGESLDEAIVVPAVYIANAIHNAIAKETEIESELKMQFVENAGLQDRLPHFMETCRGIPLEGLAI